MYLGANKTALFPEPVYITGSKPPLDFFEAAFQYNDGYSETMSSFVNNINTHEAGTHVTGFKTALTRSSKHSGQARKLLKPDETLTGDDLKEGLVAVVNVKVPNPQFEGQTKAKLGNSEIKGLVESIVNEQLGDVLRREPGHREGDRRKGRRNQAGEGSGEEGEGTDPRQSRREYRGSCPASWRTARKATPLSASFTSWRGIRREARRNRAGAGRPRPSSR